MIKKHDIPILEYDDEKEALIHAPNILEKQDISPYCVLTFFQDVIDAYKQENKLHHVYDLRSEAGKHPLYEMDIQGKKVCIIHPMLGGPYAAAFIEELVALGCSKFIACGGCGVLDSSLRVGQLIIPTDALRCDGVSYHYLPAKRTVDINPIAIDAICDVLQEEKIPYVLGRTWTTDAFFRETKAMIAYRKEEGCIAVEMECASFASAAQFREVVFGQILYAGDSVASDIWDARGWNKREDIRRGIVEASIKACLKL